MALRRIERCPLPHDHEPHAHPSWDGPYCPGVPVPEPKPYVEPEFCLDVVIPDFQTFAGCGHRKAEHRSFSGCKVDGCVCPRGRAPVAPPRRRTAWPAEYQPAPPVPERLDASADVFSAAAEAEAERLAVGRAVAGRGDVPESAARDLAIIAVRTALGSAGVRREVERQHKDGYDSGVDAMSALSLASDAQVERYESALRGAEAHVAALLDERDRLAAALADATGKIAAGITVCDETEWAASVVWNYGQGVAAEQGRRVREALTDESAA